MKLRAKKSEEDLLDEFCRYLSSTGRKPVTVKNYRGDVRAAMEWLRRRFAWPFDGSPAHKAKLHHYRSHLAGAFEPTSANRKLAALNTFLQWAAAQSYIASSVPKLKSLALAPKSDSPCLSPDRAEQLLRSVREKGTPSEELIFRLFLECGLRVNEVCALRWDNVKIEADAGTLEIPHPRPPSPTFQKSLKKWGMVKGPEDINRWSRRTVAVTAEALALFREMGYLDKHGSSDPVFERDRGRMTRRAVELMLGRQGQMAGTEASVRILLQTYSTNERKKRGNLFDDLMAPRPDFSSTEEPGIPLSKPGGIVRLSDSFNDLLFTAYGTDTGRELLVSFYSAVAPDAEVRKAVLKRAKGKCERCGFFCDNPGFLDVHHIIPPASGEASLGHDRFDNCVTLCPNCHREAHLKDRWESVQGELRQIVRQVSAGLRSEDHRE